MHLSSKRVLSEFKLDARAFEWLLGEIETRYYFAQVSRGSRVWRYKTGGLLRQFPLAPCPNLIILLSPCSCMQVACM